MGQERRPAPSGVMQRAGGAAPGALAPTGPARVSGRPAGSPTPPPAGGRPNGGPDERDGGRVVPRRVLLGAFGDPGHAFPTIALGKALLARGHKVTVQTWERWRAPIEAEGLGFAAAPEYDVFPVGEPDGEGRPRPLGFYEAVVHATHDTLPLVRELAPDVVVADILTLAPALAAESCGMPCATLIPHVNPHQPPGAPIYSIGARLPRTAVGRAFWRRAGRPAENGLERGRRDLNAVRQRLGLPALPWVHNGTSRELALVASFPQLEYPRAFADRGTQSGATYTPARGRDAHVHVVGPLFWEPPAADIELPRSRQAGGTRARADGRGLVAVGPASGMDDVSARPADGTGYARTGERREDPLVLVAPSTSQDPHHRLLHAALRGLADAPVRVLATWNRRLPDRALPVPDNARVVEWVSYARTMPHCQVVVCHAGHGTLVRALACGCAVVACPVAGDMNENAARLDWAGAGVRLPRRFIAPRPLRLAVERALADPMIGSRARELAEWVATHDAGSRAAALVEDLAARSQALDRRGRAIPA
jgi:UDP:flavonoid glycosyltransferase YjiC (YdhE family)